MADDNLSIIRELTQQLTQNPALKKDPAFIQKVLSLGPAMTQQQSQEQARPSGLPRLPVSPQLIAGQAGLSGPMTKGVYEALQKEAISRSDPKYQMEEEAKRTAEGLASPFLNIIKPERMDIKSVTVKPGEFSASFGLSPEEELSQKNAEKLYEQQMKLGAGQRMAEQTFKTVSTAMRDYSTLLADAFDEGGFGNIIDAAKVAAAQKFIGGTVTKKYPRTSAIPGKKVEIITKMMPLLTQQGEKPGSVRLVSTVFERLADSLPGANRRGDVRGNDVSLEESYQMMAETIRSMFRFSQAIKSLNITNEAIENVPGKLVEDKNSKIIKPEPGTPLDEMSKLVTDTAKQFYQPGSEEATALDEYVDKVLAPMKERIERAKLKPLDAEGLSESEQAELDEIERKLKEYGG